MKTNGFNFIVHVSLSSYRICRHYCVVHPSQTKCCKICSFLPPLRLVPYRYLWVGIREEKSLPRVATVAKFLDLNKLWSCKFGNKKTRQNSRVFFLCMIVLRIRLAHTFLPSFDNVNGRLCQEGSLRSRNSATMVT